MLLILICLFLQRATQEVFYFPQSVGVELVKACLHTYCVATGLEVLQNAHTLGIEPSAQLAHLLMSEYSSQKDAEGLLKAFDTMKTLHIYPTRKTGELLALGLGKAAAFDKALEVITEFKENDISLSEVSGPGKLLNWH